LHASGGRRARDAGLTRLYALGPLSAIAAQAFGENGRVFDSHAALIAALRADLRAAVTGDQGPGTGEQQEHRQVNTEMHEHTRVAPAMVGVAATLSPVPGPRSPVPTILVKGSRGSAMDKIVSALLAHGEETPHAA
ncbi:UDP-diphospho-muramoylpentapeptide beta-N-acetylglucosaminyltransferase, partial [Xanthomonas translucens]|uniref:UDP-diphospho-muramoylpentapeptide beta-N-acetylglucosaminyltransferase n=1 Tax=Xanthomonas campestris pv. translucens TaxID=343 RepID=UPI000AAE60E4